MNENFGKIFSTLLKDADAKMKLNEYFDKKHERTYKGIEISICLGGQWKDSLSELSGG